MPDSRPYEEAPNRYAQMSTESLRQLLREDASKPAGEEGNTEDLLRVMEELAKRRQALGGGKSPEEALASFRKYYDTEEEETGKPTLRARRRFRGLAAAAAAAAILLAGTVTAGAFRFDIWEPIAQWVQETFHFGRLDQDTMVDDPEPSNAAPFSGLQETLDTYGIETKLVPTWLPEGYSEREIKIKETPRQRQFLASYQNKDKSEIWVWITDYLDSYPDQIEQGASSPVIYPSGEIYYYIFENTDMLQAAWTKGHYECFIVGPVTLTEMEQIIDSIEKG